MSKEIKFISYNEYGYQVAPRPYPASSGIPEWWKNSTPYVKSFNNPEGNKLILDNHDTNANFKKCTPMLDSLTSGYIIPLWSDVLIEEKDEVPSISWRVLGNAVFSLHGPNTVEVEAPDGYYKQVFKYVNFWIPKTPPGYSVLITSPFGYRNLPFRAIPAIIDSDKSVLEVVSPVWVKKGSSGIVEKGTPIMQVIPFKRDNWKSSFDFYTEKEFLTLQDKNFRGNIINHYLKNVWSKKVYR